VRRFVSLRGQREFSLLLRHGRAGSSDGVSVRAFSPRNKSSAKIGIVITKKVGNAVVRNRLRRRCKAVLDEFHRAPQRHWFLIHCKPETASLTFPALRAHLLRALEASKARWDPGERQP